jgi:sarcosine oxidase subunit alpha
MCEIFTNTVAITLNTQGVNAHQVSIVNEKVKSRNFHLSTSRVILATGMLERLPVFPGNRTPGVVSARTAFQLASKYGVWRGKSAAFCTSSSPATQVALLAADMGVDIKKLADSRTNPKSRFFEFAKAYGISLATGSQVVCVNSLNKRKLSAQFALSDEPSRFTGDALEIDRLVVCGGWQPNLMLWHCAGGATHWVADQQQLQALEPQNSGNSQNIQLAGSVKGAMSMTECMTSGEYAVNKLAGTKILPVKFTLESFESADGQLPGATSLQHQANCYLDMGYSLNKPLTKIKPSIWRQFIPAFGETKHHHTNISNGFSLNDVVAKVILGEIPPEYAGIFAQERCGISRNLETARPVQNWEDIPDITEGVIPAYLIGRFGKNAKTYELKIPDDINLELGSLIYPNREGHLPDNAIGAVISVVTSGTKQALAYLDMSQITDTAHVVIRYGTQAIKIRVTNEISSQ